MSPGKLITPVDRLTGIPLPILPEKFLERGNPEIANDHHAMHPSNDPRLDTSTKIGVALRTAIIYLTDNKKHNKAVKNVHAPGYHDLYYGPELPNSEQEVAELLIFTHSGGRPRRAIDLNNGNPKKVYMNDEQWAIFSAPAQMPTLSPSRMIKMHNKAARFYDKLIDPKTDKETHISDYVQKQLALISSHTTRNFHHISRGYEHGREFLSDYVSRQPYVSESPELVERFLAAKDEDKKRFWGYCLVGAGVQMVTSDMEDRYTKVRNQGRLHHLAVEHARHQLAIMLNYKDNMDSLTSAIEDNLRVELGIAA